MVVRAQAQSAAIIGHGAPLAWEHGFTLDEVPVRLDAGDTMTVPAGAAIAGVQGNDAIVFAARRA